MQLQTEERQVLRSLLQRLYQEGYSRYYLSLEGCLCGIEFQNVPEHSEPRKSETGPVPPTDESQAHTGKLHQESSAAMYRQVADMNAPQP